MMQIHFLADEHRRELVDEAQSHQPPAPKSVQKSVHECGENVPQLSILSATQRSAAGIPVTGGRAVRRAVAPRIGTWLIGAGIRLGGATVRTS